MHKRKNEIPNVTSLDIALCRNKDKKKNKGRHTFSD